MKKLLLATLAVTFSIPAFSAAPACEDYFKHMEEMMKKEGSYSDQAMKIVRDQIAAVPADQHDSFCKAASAALKDSANNSGADDKDDEDEKEGK